jgi:hypothetical protein
MQFEKACDTVRWQVLYKIVTEFAVTVELVRLIKMCLNVAWSPHRQKSVWSIP